MGTAHRRPRTTACASKPADGWNSLTLGAAARSPNCVQLGVSDATHFSRLFEETFGVSPIAFRRAHRLRDRP
ncbi:AraC family transcriptional regulator [Paraburkholderia rhizosphaerae]|uniref:AraC family transcriptional regulator n=1 Tax=Paraburkholderia rhizosphaerae TaxID=480658 RepID=UPI0035E99830